VISGQELDYNYILPFVCEIEEKKWMPVPTHTQEQDTRRLEKLNVEEHIQEIEN
jgi:hypothetical protein